MPHTFGWLIVFFLPSVPGFFHPPYGPEKFPFLESTTEHLSEVKGCEDNQFPPRDGLVSRIIGGSRVLDDKSVPYIAAIGEKSLSENDRIEWFCGGSLISENIVLTAAHCMARNAEVVRIGASHLERRPLSDDIDVLTSTIHPDYKPPETYNDLAILRLSTNVPKSVRPICISEGEAGRKAGESTIVMGWGSMELGGDASKELQKVQIRIFKSSECSKVYSKLTISNTNFPRGITDGQLCAGTPEGGKDACQGDSGGPLVVENSDGKIRLLGIVSAGVGCGAKAFPGLYVRVSAYESWIRKFLR